MNRIEEIHTEIEKLKEELKNEKERPKKEIAARLKQQRKLADMTQDEVANLLGVDRTQVTNMEGGNSWITVPNLILLCQRYDCSADEILGLRAV